jgi:hypothetical protein
MRQLIALLSIAAFSTSCFNREVRTAAACAQRAPPSLKTLLTPGAILVFGEWHGTNEIPAFFQSAICAASSENQAVRVGLEMPVDEKSHVEAFVAGVEAEKQLLASAFWTDEFQDGRRSQAMLEVLKEVRRLRSLGRRIVIEPFDVPAAQRSTPQARDDFMASTLKEVLSAPSETISLMLMGNGHARTIPGAPWSKDYRWTASQLRGAGVKFVSLKDKTAGGTAWSCPDVDPSHCGAQRVSDDDGRALEVELTPIAEGGFDGSYGVGKVSASAPAAFPERAVAMAEKIKALNDPKVLAMAATRRAARADYDAGKFAACASKLAQLTPDPGDLYDLACCHARANQLDEASGALSKAIELGFRDEKLLLEDSDLTALRADSRFASLRKKMISQQPAKP